MANPNYSPCSACCTCPPASIYSMFRNATKYKIGVATSGGTGGSDIHFWLVSTTTAVFTASSETINGGSYSGGGTVTFVYSMDASTGATSRTQSGTITSHIAYADESLEYPGLYSYDASATIVSPSDPYNQTNWTQSFTTDNPGESGGNYTDQPNEVSWSFSAVSPISGLAAGPRTSVNSSEYTNQDVYNAAIAALPAWSTTFSPGIGSDGSLGLVLAYTTFPDQTQLVEVFESKYYVTHPVPPSGYYKVTWIERFTPDGGGAVTDTPMSYTWDGTIPSGYDVNTPSTWPKGETYEVDAPPYNTPGHYDIVDFASACHP